MRRALALTLVCCCVLSGAALAVPNEDGSGLPSGGGVQSVVAPTTNTTAYLMIQQSALETSNYRQATLDITGTLALDSHGLRARFGQLTLDKRFATASTDARRAQLRETAARIEARIEQLRKRQSAAIRAYNNGSLSAHEFVVSLARIGAAAERLETATDRVAERTSSVPQSSIDGLPAVNWARNRYIELGPLDGPVRERIAEALRGEHTVRVSETVPAGLDRIGPIRDEEATPLWVYVETSRTGIVLATADDVTYYREAYLPGERNSTGEGVTDITDAFRRVRDRYPWAWNNSASTDSSGDRRAGVYRFTLFHDHGRLTTYLDRDSGRVFAEQQRKNLMSAPTAEPVSATAGNLTLTVNRTHPTGPLGLSLSRTNDKPVNGRIIIANHSIGRTGADGHLWTVMPRGAFTVIAHVNGKTVRVTTSAVTNRTAIAPRSW